MKFSRSIIGAVAAVALLAVLAVPLAAAAHGHGYACDQRHRPDPEQRARFAHRYLDRQAAMLEIKASQQSAWDAYAAAKLELMTGFGAKPLSPDADAATVARRRAERAEAAAQSLGKLADATAKLQATLTGEQREVLDRMTRSHWHGHDRHDKDRRRRNDRRTPKPTPKP